MSRSIPTELAPYLRQPPAMQAGATGKYGELELYFEATPSGKTVIRHLYRRAPLIVQQALYFDEELPTMPCVYILSSGGPNVDGDRYRQVFCLGEGAMAHISTGAATKIAPMRYNHASMHQEIRLADGAYLEYLPEPTIPCREARYRSECQITIAPTATLFYSEIYTSGRRHHNGESFRYDLLSLSTTARRDSGEELFGEKMVIMPHSTPPEERWVMKGYDTFATVFILTPKEHIDKIYDQIESYKDSETALGISRLPADCGLVCRVLSTRSDRAKAIVRRLCSVVRKEIKGRPLPEEFPWR